MLHVYSRIGSHCHQRAITKFRQDNPGHEGLCHSSRISQLRWGCDFGLYRYCHLGRAKIWKQVNDGLYHGVLVDWRTQVSILRLNAGHGC